MAMSNQEGNFEDSSQDHEAIMADLEKRVEAAIERRKQLQERSKVKMQAMLENFQRVMADNLQQMLNGSLSSNHEVPSEVSTSIPEYELNSAIFDGNEGSLESCCSSQFTSLDSAHQVFGKMSVNVSSEINEYLGNDSRKKSRKNNQYKMGILIQDVAMEFQESFADDVVELIDSDGIEIVEGKKQQVALTAVGLGAAYELGNNNLGSDWSSRVTISIDVVCYCDTVKHLGSRAEEHLPNTLRQALIYKAVGFPMPSFAHVSLILFPDRGKLSKRHDATSVGQFREMGYLLQVIVHYLALLGWSDGTDAEFCTLEQMVEKFTIDSVNKSGAIFDSVKWRWMNGQHLKALPTDELLKAIGEQWRSAGILKESEGPFVEDAFKLLEGGIDVITDAKKLLLDLLSYPFHDTLSSSEGREILEDGIPVVAESLLDAYDSGELLGALDEGKPGWQKWVKAFGNSLKRKGKSLFMPLRVLLTGKLHGPDMGKSIGSGTIIDGDGIILTCAHEVVDFQSFTSSSKGKVNVTLQDERSFED